MNFMKTVTNRYRSAFIMHPILLLCCLLICPSSVLLAEENSDISEEDERSQPNYATEVMRYEQQRCGDKTHLMMFTPTGDLVMGCDDGSVQLLNPKTAEILWRSPPDNPGLNFIVFPNDNTLMTVTSDRRVVLYDLLTRSELTRYEIPIQDGIYAVRSAANQVLIATKNSDRTNELIIFTAETGAVIAKYPAPVRIQDIALSPTGEYAGWILVNEADTVYWIKTRKIAKSKPKSFNCKLGEGSDISARLRFSPDETTITLIFSRYEGNDNIGLCIHAMNGSIPTRDVVRRIGAELIPDTGYYSANGKYLQIIGWHTDGGREGPSIFFGYDTFIVDTASGTMIEKLPPSDIIWEHNSETTFIKGTGQTVILNGSLWQINH